MKQFIVGLSLAGAFALSGTTFAATPSATPSGLEVSCISKTVAPAALCQFGNDEETAKVFPLPHGFYGYGYATPSDTSTDVWEGR
ncbi:MAG: hypothetical protein AAGF95_32160 [Chloroflexota bacterium]